MPRNLDAGNRILRSWLRMLVRIAWLPGALIALAAIHLALEAGTIDLVLMTSCLVIAAQLSAVATASWTVLWVLSRLGRAPEFESDQASPIEPPRQRPELTVVAVERRRPFHARLAQFLGIEQSQVSPASARSSSRMTFWTSLPWIVPSRPKSAAMIRQLLARVQQRRSV